MPKIYLFVISLITLFTFSAYSQSNNNMSLRGDINGFAETIMTYRSSLSSSWLVTIQAGATNANSGFLFSPQGTNFNPKWGNGAFVNFNTKSTAFANGGNGTYNQVSGKFYTFIIRDVSSGTNTDDYVFETSATPVSVSTVVQSPASASTIGISAPVTVTATTSATLPVGQGVFLRYTTNSFSTTTVVNMTGAGTSYSATIPGQAATTNVIYYVFTSGGSTPPSGSDADLSTINLNNNSGSNYNYTVSSSYTSKANGNWSTPATWSSGSVPPSGASVVIANNVVLDVDATVSALTVSSGATFTASDASARMLTVNSNASGTTLTNNGTFNYGTGASTIAFTGNSNGSDVLQTVTGSIAFQNVTISKIAGSSNNEGVIFGSSTLTGSLQINSGGYVSSAPTSFYASGASLIFNSSYTVLTTDATWPSLNPPGSITVLSGTVTMSAARSIIGVLSISAGATLNLSGQSFTIKSTATATAHIAPILGTLSGATNVTVERYIPDDSRRAFRLLSVPTTTTNTTNTAWMNGQTPGTAGPAGLGTWVTGPIASSSTTFDFKTGNGGMFKGYNGSAYVSVTRTDTSINTDKGFLLFVRGDRTLNTTNTGSNSTTLKSTGTLKQGSYPTTAIPVAAASFEIVGNPYASQVNMKNVTMGADPKFYIFDPKLGTTGGYQTCSSTGPGTDYTINPGGGSYGANGSIMDTIQSGQAFFVYSTSGTASATTFGEANKSTGSSNGGFSPLSLSERLITNLYTVNGGINSLADGTTTDFGSTFSNSVDMYDAIKLNNFGLNLGMTRNGYNLSVERKQPIGTTDTVFYNLTGAAQQQYQFEFLATQLNHPNLFGFLQDSYLNTSTPINLDGTTTVNFTIDGNAASAAANRFRIVFGPVSALPVTFSNVKAYSQGTNIAVEWSVENERNMRQYEVEKSLDGSAFTRTTTVTAINANASNYNWLDVHAVTGYNYYRIRSTDINGNIKYSVIVKVLVGSGKQDIVIYPNPVVDGKINLQLNNMPGGTYGLRLINSLGQSVFSKLIQHADGSSTESVNLSSGLAKGIYQLEVTKPDHSRIVKQVNY